MIRKVDPYSKFSTPREMIFIYYIYSILIEIFTGAGGRKFTYPKKRCWSEAEALQSNITYVNILSPHVGRREAEVAAKQRFVLEGSLT